MTAHLSGPVAVIWTQEDLLRESAERFHERARRENEAARLGDLRVWLSTQDGWDWPNENPAPLQESDGRQERP
jgi:hypothetical protein